MKRKPKTKSAPEYFLLGAQGTNVVKKVGSEYYCLMGEIPNVQWSNQPRLIQYFVGDPNTVSVTEEVAKAKYAEITGGQPWK